MGIKYTDPPTDTVATNTDPTDTVATNTDPDDTTAAVTAMSDYDECTWKELYHSDANQQPGDDSGDEILEAETYP